MNRELNFFADEDVEVLRSLIAREKQRPLNAPYRNNPAPNTDQMPEVHVAKTTGLMPALEVHPTGQDEPGSALCTIYRLLEGKLWSLTIPTAVVYNLGSSPIPSGSWVLVQRDRFGDWFAGSALDECVILKSFSGYNGSVVQILGHSASGVCTWYNVSECP